MAKYTSDANLIRGAAAAYKNYDNAPGMYAGLDKAIKAGTDTMKTAVKDYEAEQEKIKKEAAAEKKKKKDQDNAWYKAAGDTYNAAGSFMKADGPELTDTIALLDVLQPEYTKAMESGTAAEKAAVNARYQTIKASVDGHKQLRADISDDLIGASDANFNTGTLGGDDGRFGDFLTGLLKEDYKITYKTDSDGVKQKMYTVGDTSYSLEQINEKTVRKNRKPAVDYYDARTSLSEKETYDEAETRMVVKNIIPQGYNEMRDFMRGDYFDTGNFASLLEKDRERLKLEIGAQFDLDNKNGIDNKEFDNFISAATDPYHEMWNKDGKVDKQGWEDSSRAIAEDLLVNGIKNKQALDNPEDPIWKKEGYANKGAYLKALKANNIPDKEEETLKYGGFGYTSRTNGDPDGGLESFGNVSYGDKVARRSSLLNFEIVRGEHYQYRFEMDDETKENVWKAYSKKDASFVRNMKDGAEIAGIEGLKGTQDTSDSFFNIEQVIQDKKNKTNQTASIPGGVTQELLSGGNVDEIIKSFDEGVESKWTFLNSLDSDMMPRKDRIVLQNKKTGKETTIKLGPNATAEDAETVNKLLSDYVMSGPEPE